MRRYRNILGYSLLVNVLIALTDLTTAPLHAHGRGQDVLGYVNGIGQILQLPGFTVSEMIGLRPGHRWTWSAFYCGMGINLVFYAIVFAAAARWGRWGRRRQVITEHEYEFGVGPDDDDVKQENRVEDHLPGQRLSRRALIMGGGRAIVGGAAAAGAWGFFAEARWFEVTRRQIPIRGLAPELDGLRIVQLSDIHHGTWMSARWVQQIVDVSNSLSPDVVALTGDYVYRGSEYAAPVARLLAGLSPRIGTVGVMGNHDWWDGGIACREAFSRERIPLIDNGRRFITTDKRLVADATEGLCLAGVGDLWEDKCNYRSALGGISGGMPRILLSHNPDVAEEPEFLRGGYRVDLMLAGHTHGGQIRLPGFGAPVTNSRFGQKYAKDLVEGPICPVFISRGLGMTVMPVRFGVRPEIAVIELRSA